MKKVIIFLPYKQVGNGEELKLALRSIAKNCNFDYDLALVGDCPDWVNKESLIHLQTEIPVAKEFPKAWNVIEKFKHILGKMETEESMLLTYDDIVFLKPVTEKEIGNIIAVAKLPEDGSKINSIASDTWEKIMQNTIAALKRNKLPMLNFETHLPRLFNVKKIKELIALFGFEKRPYAIPTLYFNWVKSNKKKYILSDIPDQKIKAGIHFPGDFEKYADILEEYMYLNWGETNWNQDLEDKLLFLFPDKSIFEL